MFTHRPIGRVGAQLYPEGIVARYRNPARDLDRPNRNRSVEKIPKGNRDRAPEQPTAASFPADSVYRGFQHWFVSYAFLPCYSTRPAAGGPHCLGLERRSSRLSVSPFCPVSVCCTPNGGLRLVCEHGS